MKEAKKPLPPKCGNTLTPTKAPDEILSSLLRLNNYDSFSSIKDESLDIDLSACVTINAGDSAPGLNGNSFSSTDFWRMLDENAQTPQLELTLSALSDESMSKMSDSGALDPQPHHSTRVTTTPMTMTTTPVKTSSSSSSSSSSVIKIDNFNVSFGDKFIRPNPPVSLHSIMPMRKTPVKVSAAQQSNEPIDQRILNSIPKELTITRVMVEPIKLHDIKMEPIEVLPDILVDEEKYNAEQLMLAEQQQEQMVNDEGLSLYKCVDCDGLMLRKQDLSKHELAAHRLLLLCSICMREFEQEAGLKKHLKTHRSNETRKDTWRKCPDCGKCLKLGSMWMHRKIHSDNKKYGCDICGQKFVQKINLTHHSRVHTAEKPYECPECQKRFQERSHLQRHQKYHAQTRSYRCEKCGKMYKTERCLKVHNLVHLEQRPFACNVCDKSFISNSKLKQHSNIHTGERPFKCNYCPRDFTNFPNWLKHTRRRHKVDHKTGQQLENIPSYCSKKSTKTTKAAKANTPNSDDTSNNISKPKLCSSSNKAAAAAVSSGSSGGTAVAEVATNNVKNSTESSTSTYLLLQQRSNDSNKLKSTTTPTILAPPTIKLQQQNSSQKPQENMQINNATSSTINVKPAKAKRERKQSTPRQVQKPPKAANVTVNVTTLSTSSAINISTTTAIKKEPTNSPPSSKHPKQSDFPDLHGLSLTSAEELIMEQALEMEECGLYDAPINIGGGDTDNAISAEAAAALQFKIKSEFNDNGGGCNEEFISLKEPNNRLLCSSLESSPYSSPASVELTATTTKLPSVSPTSNAAAPLTTTYYMQPFALNAAQQGTMLARLCTTNNNLSNVVVDSSTMQLIPQILTQSHNQQTTNALPPTTQALINQFFLPMTVNIHHHQQQQQQQSSSKQTLPSVETLLFSAAAHTNGASSIFSTDKSTNNATQSTTSSAALAIQRNLS